MTVEHLMEHADPIRQQIMGKSTGGHGYTSPGENDVPLPGMDSGTPRLRSRHPLTRQHNGWAMLPTLNQSMLPNNRPPRKPKAIPFFCNLKQKIVYF